jgi:hypothetical protein
MTMHTRYYLKRVITAGVGCLLMATTSFAQLPVAGNVPPPPPPPGPGMPPPPPGGPIPGPAPMQHVAAYTGTVLNFVSNDDLEYDGFYLVNQGDTLLVKFPPHQGKSIYGELKPGVRTTVNGILNNTPAGTKEVRMLSVKTGNSTITDTGAPVALPIQEEYTSGNSTISKLQLNREGLPIGLFLGNNVLLRLTPGVASQFGTELKAGGNVGYTGMKKPAGTTALSSADYTIVHCKTITVNGHQYMVQ